MPSRDKSKYAVFCWDAETSHSWTLVRPFEDFRELKGRMKEMRGSVSQVPLADDAGSVDR